MQSEPKWDAAAAGRLREEAGESERRGFTNAMPKLSDLRAALAEIERLTRERSSLSEALGNVEAELERRTRERDDKDRAIRDILEARSDESLERFTAAALTGLTAREDLGCHSAEDIACAAVMRGQATLAALKKEQSPAPSNPPESPEGSRVAAGGEGQLGYRPRTSDEFRRIVKSRARIKCHPEAVASTEIPAPIADLVLDLEAAEAELRRRAAPSGVEVDIGPPPDTLAVGLVGAGYRAGWNAAREEYRARALAISGEARRGS